MYVTIYYFFTCQKSLSDNNPDLCTYSNSGGSGFSRRAISVDLFLPHSVTAYGCAIKSTSKSIFVHKHTYTHMPLSPPPHTHTDRSTKSVDVV